MRIDELTKKYLQLRELKSKYDKEHKEKTAKIKETMAKIEAVFLQHFTETGQDSAPTKYGTPYTQLRESFTVADRDSYLNFVIENEAWEMLENRVSKTAIQEYKKEHGELPPGINYSAERVINVRSSSK
jgi:hypothetical protein